MVGEMKSLALADGLRHLIIPVRPSRKSEHPTVLIAEYLTWKQQDGSYFDPWMRIRGPRSSASHRARWSFQGRSLSGRGGRTSDFPLEHEPLLRLALCDLGSGKPTPLLVAGHSLVVDMQSWQFLMDDIQSVYRQISQGEQVQLPPKTTSYIQWAQRLQEYAGAPELQAELPYWLSEQRQQVQPLPKDFPEGESTGASLRMALDMLTLDETSALLATVARIEGLQVDGMLLTALAQALMEWMQGRTLLVTVEGHGRNSDFDDIDLSRTLGTLAMDYPLLLDFHEMHELGAALNLVKAELKQLGKRGINYNALTAFNSDTATIERLKALPKPDVFFNYLATSVAPEVTDYRVSGPYNGRLYTNDETTLHPLTLLVTGYLADGQLQVSWHYSINQFRPETVDRLATRTIAHVREILAYLQQGNNQ